VRIRVLIVALLALGVSIPAVLFLNQQPASAANMVLTIIDGSAEVARGAGPFTRVADGVVLSAGDRVRTSDRSHAVVTFLDGSTMELEPATAITIVQVSAASTGAITIQIAQALGRTWSSIQRLARSDSKFELRTPSATATVRGTGFATDVLPDGTTTVTTTDGTVEVVAQGQTVVVPAGSSTNVQPGTPPSPPALSPRPPNTLRFGLHSPARLVVLDGLGRACGIVPAGSTLVRQIPGCLATESGIDPQLIDLPSAAPGTYSVVIETVAPGGDFVATASAIDGAGNLTFNYRLSAGGPPGTRFGSTLAVENTADGALRASGFGKLALLDRSPTRVVVMPVSPRPLESAGPNESLFAPLPRFGYTSGFEVTQPPSSQAAASSPSPSASPSPTPTASPTEVVAAEPTSAPTVAPARTAAPPPPTPAPPTPTPTEAPTPSPTASPQPTPIVPSVIGGFASPGSLFNVSGHGWSTAVITISWEDGRPLVQAQADASGDFTAAITVPFDTVAGSAYRVTANDTRSTATGQIAVYAPAILVTCAAATAPVSVSGSGWPALTRYALRSSLLATPLLANVGADGTFSTSFMPPPGSSTGDYQITANVGSLVAAPQTCTLR
jgi:hypothetical protein